jgi:CRP-like cAMP-binding protein
MMDEKTLRKHRAKLDKALAANRDDEAIQLLAGLVSAEPTNARWPHKRGDLLRKVGRRAEAVAAYEQAVDVYAKTGFIARAVAMAKTVLSLDPSRTDVLMRVDPQAAQQLHRQARPASIIPGAIRTNTNPGTPSHQGGPGNTHPGGRHPAILDDASPVALALAAARKRPVVVEEDPPEPANDDSGAEDQPLIVDDDESTESVAVLPVGLDASDDEFAVEVDVESLPPARHAMVLDDEPVEAPKKHPMVLDDDESFGRPSQPEPAKVPGRVTAAGGKAAAAQPAAATRVTEPGAKPGLQPAAATRVTAPGVKSAVQPAAATRVTAPGAKSAVQPAAAAVAAPAEARVVRGKSAEATPLAGSPGRTLAGVAAPVAPAPGAGAPAGAAVAGDARGRAAPPPPPAAATRPRAAPPPVPGAVRPKPAPAPEAPVLTLDRLSLPPLQAEEAANEQSSGDSEDAGSAPPTAAGRAFFIDDDEDADEAMAEALRLAASLEGDAEESEEGAAVDEEEEHFAAGTPATSAQLIAAEARDEQLEELAERVAVSGGRGGAAAAFAAQSTGERTAHATGAQRGAAAVTAAEGRSAATAAQATGAQTAGSQRGGVSAKGGQGIGAMRGAAPATAAQSAGATGGAAPARPAQPAAGDDSESQSHDAIGAAAEASGPRFGAEPGAAARGVGAQAVGVTAAKTAGAAAAALPPKLGSAARQGAAQPAAASAAMRHGSAVQHSSGLESADAAQPAAGDDSESQSHDAIGAAAEASGARFGAEPGAAARGVGAQAVGVTAAKTAGAVAGAAALPPKLGSAERQGAVPVAQPPGARVAASAAQPSAAQPLTPAETLVTGALSPAPLTAAEDADADEHAQAFAITRDSAQLPAAQAPAAAAASPGSDPAAAQRPAAGAPIPGAQPAAAPGAGASAAQPAATQGASAPQPSAATKGVFGFGKTADAGKPGAFSRLVGATRASLLGAPSGAQAGGAPVPAAKPLEGGRPPGAAASPPAPAASGIKAPSPAAAGIKPPVAATGIRPPVPAAGMKAPTPATGIKLPTTAAPGIKPATPVAGATGIKPPPTAAGIHTPSPAAGSPERSSEPGPQSRNSNSGQLWADHSGGNEIPAAPATSVQPPVRYRGPTMLGAGPKIKPYEPPPDEAELFSRALEAAIELKVAPDQKPNETRFSNAPPGPGLELSTAEVSDRPEAALNEEHDAVPHAVGELSNLPLFPLFAEMPQEALGEMVTDTELIELSDGDIVIRKGDPGDALFGIVEGSVMVVVPNHPQGLTLAEGDVFGESCLLQDEPRHADVRVVGRLTALKIPRHVLTRALRRYPQLAELLLELLTRRLLANLLQTSPLFSTFDAEGRRELSRMFEVRRAPAGTKLSIAGKLMDGLYISLTGTLSVEAVGQAPRIAPPGSMFGHTLLSREPASTSVTARVNLVVLRLPATAFAHMAMEYPTIVEHLAELSTNDVVSVSL